MTAIAEESTSTVQKTMTKVSGVVDLADARGFLRTAGYRRDAGDIPISPAQVRQYGLRSGDHIEGAADSRDGRTKDKGRALLAVETVNISGSKR
jgi:transcription termination factor Rho